MRSPVAEALAASQTRHVEGRHLPQWDAELMFYVEHAENSPASVLINCLKH